MPDGPIIRVCDLRKPFRRPNILAVCRRTRTEASSLFYGKPVFLFSNPSASFVQAWISTHLRDVRCTVKIKMRLLRQVAGHEKELRLFTRELRCRVRSMGMGASVEFAFCVSERGGLVDVAVPPGDVGEASTKRREGQV